MEAIFHITPKNGKVIPDNRVDYELYLLQNDNEEMIASFKLAAKTSQKMRMYAFLFGVVMDCAVRGYTRKGWEGMDKVKARYKLQAEFCKAEMYNSVTKKTEVYLEELSAMSKTRLWKFIQDCIWYVENNLEEKVPDSEKYKMDKIYGKSNFESVRQKG